MSVFWAAVAVLTARPPAACARPATRLCVRFSGPGLKNPDGYRRLIADEIRHRKSHVPATRQCDAVMYMEYIRLDAGGMLTGRVGNGLPHRVNVKRIADLPARIREVVTVLLKNEPVYLVENLATSGLLRRRPQSLHRDGHNFYGVEFTHLWIWADSSMSYFPAGAFRFRRAVDRWFVGARGVFGYNPAPLSGSRQRHPIRLFGAGQVELGVNFLRDAFVTPYVSGLVGVAFLQVLGEAGPDGTRESLVTALATASVRVGVEFMRFYDIRMDLFAAVHLPLHKARDIDTRIVDAYTPSVAVGCGVAF